MFYEEKHSRQNSQNTTLHVDFFHAFIITFEIPFSLINPSGSNWFMEEKKWYVTGIKKQISREIEQAQERENETREMTN